MSAPRRFHPTALLLPLLAAGPTLMMGYTREDWLFLWRALTPESAPPDALGVFPRPLAWLLWKGATFLGGDHPLAMHLPMFLLALLLAAGVARLASMAGGRSRGAAEVAAAVVGCHAALVEPRLWASASNGLLAAALGVWGVVLVLQTVGGGSKRRRLAGAILLYAAGLARADAWALLLLVIPPLVARNRRAAGVALWALTIGVGVLAMGWMVRAGGAWALQPAATGELFRRMIVPWGPPLPAAPASVLALVGLALVLTMAGRTHGVARGAWLLLGVGPVAAGLVSWAPAGRYLLVSMVGLGLLLGPGLEHLTQRRWLRLAVVFWLLLNLFGAILGNTAEHLMERSHAETGLYRAVRERLAQVPSSVTLVDAPPMGWRSSAPDAENVVGAALRRPVPVQLHEGADPPRADLLLGWDHDRWTSVPAP